MERKTEKGIEQERESGRGGRNREREKREQKRNQNTKNLEVGDRPWPVIFVCLFCFLPISGQFLFQ